MDWTRLPLSRSGVDRDARRRSRDDVLAEVAAAPGTQVLLVHEGRLAVRDDALDLRAAADLRALGLALPVAHDTEGPDAQLWLYLGHDDGDPDAAYLALVIPDRPAAEVGLEGVPVGQGGDDLVAGAAWSTLRDMGHLLGDRDAGLAASAVGLAAWHERHPRCPRCGGVTTPAQGGWTRHCVADGSDHYPRTDPAVIMSVVDPDDRLLLARAPHWPERRFSTLAGYVEPGESLESAVRREVAEEVGVVVGDVVYRGSQPWPFPASLMLAFTARATSTDLTVDGIEIVDARWFTRAELGSALASGEVRLPMRTSVSRALIEEWFGGPL